MRHKSFDGMHCPIARSLSRVGDWWNILILREAFYGSTRFDQFQRTLGIATNTLAKRLGAMVEQGTLERRRYSERPPRDEYVLTERGRDFRPILIALMAWGNQHFSPEGKRVALTDADTGRPVDPVLVDRNTGRPLADKVAVIAGPAADDQYRRRFANPTFI